MIGSADPKSTRIGAAAGGVSDQYAFVELPTPAGNERELGLSELGEGARGHRMRCGLAEMLQLYVVNVKCDSLVLSSEYECIAIVERKGSLDVLEEEAAAEEDAEAGSSAARRRIVGGCCYRVWSPLEAGGKAFVELSLIAVRHEYQGQGLGGTLMKRLEARTKREKNAETVLAYADNAAFAFFRRLGFTRTVTTPFKEWKGRIVDYSDGAVVAEKLIEETAAGARPSFGGGGAAPRCDPREVLEALGAKGTSQALATGVTKCTSGRPNCYCKSGRTRAIVRYDGATGEVLEEYCSTSDAARKIGVGAPKITHVLSGTNESCDGHKFRYKVEVPWVRGGGPKAVVEIDPVSGAPLREFESAVHAARSLGLSNSSVGQVCNGKLGHTEGHCFRFRETRVYPCSVCGTDHDAGALLLCDGLLGRCVSTAHTYCIGLDAVPDGEWFCADCTAKGEHLPKPKTAPFSPKPSRKHPPARASKRKPATPPKYVYRDDFEDTSRSSASASASLAASSRPSSPRLSTAEKLPPTRSSSRKQPPPSLPSEPESDDNDNHCSYCRLGGELLCCDTCDRAFHLPCAQVVDVPDGDWSCPVCVTPEGSRLKKPRLKMDL